MDTLSQILFSFTIGYFIGYKIQQYQMIKYIKTSKIIDDTIKYVSSKLDCDNTSIMILDNTDLSKITHTFDRNIVLILYQHFDKLNKTPLKWSFINFEKIIVQKI